MTWYLISFSRTELSVKRDSNLHNEWWFVKWTKDSETYPICKTELTPLISSFFPSVIRRPRYHLLRPIISSEQVVEAFWEINLKIQNSINKTTK